MQSISRLMTNICSEKLQESKDFYTTLFDFDVNFESDWFIHLMSRDKQLELGIIDRENEIVPEDAKSNPNGFYVTFVVENVDELFKKANEKDMEVVELPHDTSYGQRRLVLKDPNGVLVDISAPIPGFEFS